MFWVWIVGVVVVIIGASVLIGKMLSRPSQRQMTRGEQMTALKASGALRHRKESRR